jgi:hypothetical protein
MLLPRIAQRSAQDQPHLLSPEGEVKTLNGALKSGVRFPRESPANLLLWTPTGQMTEVL